MSWQERLDRWQRILTLQAGIAGCKRVLWLSQHIHNIEMIRMADLAEILIPALQKELDDVRRSR